MEPAYVEFYNPKIKSELEKKDDEIRKRTGLKGAAPGGDEWVWLTSYSRVPVSYCFEFVENSLNFHRRELSLCNYWLKCGGWTRHSHMVS